MAWNDMQSLTYCRRGTLLFFEAIHQFQGHTGCKNDYLNPFLSKIFRLVAANKPLRFALLFIKKILKSEWIGLKASAVHIDMYLQAVI